MTPSNDQPEIIVDTDDLIYIEKDADGAVSPMTISPNLQIIDPDSEYIIGATVQISGNYQQEIAEQDYRGQDVLLFENTDNITGTWDAATGTLTLTGTATVAEYQAALRSVQFEHNGGVRDGDDPYENTRTVTFTVTDDSGEVNAQSLSVDRDFQVDAVNDSPELTPVEEAIDYYSGEGAMVIDDDIALTDIDDDRIIGAVVQISEDTYVGGEDILGFVDSNGIRGQWNAATGTLTLTGTATKAEYEAAIQSITYENTSDIPTYGERYVTITVTDENSRDVGNYLDGSPGEDTSATAVRIIDVQAAAHKYVYEEKPVVDALDAIRFGTPEAEPFGPLAAGALPGLTPLAEAGEGAPLLGTRDLRAAEAIIQRPCSLEEVLKVGCYFANTSDPDAKFNAVKWDNLGWEKPLLDEEYDMYPMLFIRELDDPGFNIPAGEFAANMGDKFEMAAVPTKTYFEGDPTAGFKDIDPNELKDAFFEGREELDKSSRWWSDNAPFGPKQS